MIRRFLLPIVLLAIVMVHALGRASVGIGVRVGSSTAPSASTLFTGSKITGFTSGSSKYLSAPPLTFPGLASGQSLVYLFSWDAPALEAGDFEALHFAGTSPGGNLATAGDKGMLIAYATSAGQLNLYMLNGATLTTKAMGQPVCGLNALVIWNDGVHVNTLLTSATSGVVTTGSVQQIASPTWVAPDSGSTQSFGKWPPSASISNFYAGGILEFVGLNRVPTSNAEAQSWTQVVCPTSPANRFVLPPALTSDASVTVDLRASDFNVSGWTTGGSAPMAITVNGAPTTTSLSETFTADVSPYVVDGYTTSLSGNHVVSDTLGRLVFTSALSQQQVGVSFVNTDTSSTTKNFDMLGAFADGTYIGSVPTSPTTYADGLTHLFWAQIGTAPTSNQTTHAVQIPSGAQIQEPSGGTTVGGYIAGIQTTTGQAYTTTSPAKRLVLYGDSTTIGYYQVPPQQGLAALIRADFPTSGGPGGVDAFAAGGRRLYDDTANGTSVTALAAAINARAQAVAGGGSKTVYISIGINDYFIPVASWTAAAFTTQAGALVDALHALDATTSIWVQEMIQSHYYAIANSNGDTLSAFNTGISGLSGGRAWLNIANSSAAWSVTFSDFIHPDVSGYSTWKGLVKTALAY
jgi:lysophospholipase L1-like esterase